MLKKHGREIAIFGLLVVLCIFVQAMNPRFMGVTNLTNMARLIGIYGIFSIGAAIVIITSGIDLSVGSMFALLGVLLSIALVDHKWSSFPGVAAILAVGAALGALHGFLITKVKLQPFIVTLCGLLIYRGLAQFIAHDETKGFGASAGFEGLKSFVTGNLLGVPTQFVLMVIIALFAGVFLHLSIYGRHLYAVGRNEEAARYSGIETRRVIVGAYVISGVLAGISAILLAFYTNSISPSTHGSSYELYGIAAAVLGGCSLRGGEGSIIGVLLGTALLQVLQNLVNLLGIPSSLNFAVVGVVILIGVIFDRVLNRENR
ncbi:MAG: ABC transporter permease [Armatimonadetes bacterium]|nr:ABC transporter permease [Armatimonadota bacterium]